MNSVAKLMDFDVYTDLKVKKDQYNVKIELENEVDSNSRELAITLAGSIVRNNYKGIYGKRLNDEELAKTIYDTLNSWVPSDTGFRAKNVTLSLKKLNIR